MKKVLWSMSAVASCALFFVAVQQGFGVSEVIHYTAVPQVQAAVDYPVVNSGNEMVDAINRERISRGKTALIADKSLIQLAALRAEDMVARQYYAHTNPDGITYNAYFNGLPDYSCENLNLTHESVFDQTIADWLQSGEHAACLLNTRVTRAGIAQAQFTLEPFQRRVYVLILASE